jgi:hypothetical protein
MDDKPVVRIAPHVKRSWYTASSPWLRPVGSPVVEHLTEPVSLGHYALIRPGAQCFARSSCKAGALPTELPPPAEKQVLFGKDRLPAEIANRRSRMTCKST